MLRRMSSVTTGTVVGSADAGDAQTVPVLTFTTPDGTVVRFEGTGSMGRFVGPKIGDRLPVRYNPADPSEAWLAKFSQAYGGLVITSVGAVGLLAVSVLTATSLALGWP